MNLFLYVMRFCVGHDSRLQSGFYVERQRTGIDGASEAADDNNGQHERRRAGQSGRCQNIFKAAWTGATGSARLWSYGFVDFR